MTVHNPAFIPSRIPSDRNSRELLPEIQFTANEALANMLAIEKCDQVVINPLFGSGLPYEPKVDKAAINYMWPIKPIRTDPILLPPPSPR